MFCTVFLVPCVGVVVFGLPSLSPDPRPPDLPKFRFFSPLPPHYRSFFFLLEVFSLNCGRGSRPWTTQIARLGFSWIILCEPQRPRVESLERKCGLGWRGRWGWGGGGGVMGWGGCCWSFGRKLKFNFCLQSFKFKGSNCWGLALNTQIVWQVSCVSRGFLFRWKPWCTVLQFSVVRPESG